MNAIFHPLISATFTRRGTAYGYPPTEVPEYCATLRQLEPKGTLVVQMQRFILGVGLAILCATAQAQEDFPAKPITLVMPYPAGGGGDYLTRVLAVSLQKSLGKPVVVKNVVGAGGTIGSAEVARAKPDGYTLLNQHVGMATAPTLYKDLTFDPMKSFEPIGLWADTPMALLAGKNFLPSTVKELVSYVKGNKEKVTIASSGMGSVIHLCAMQFEKVMNTKVTMVQYNGGPPAYADVLSGRVDLICDVTASGIIGQIQSGTLKAFVVARDKRLDSLPNLPASSEVDLPDFTVSVWYGLYAPAGTPKPIIERLSTALQAATKDPLIRAQLAKTETTLLDSSQATPKALREKLSAEMEFWRPLIQNAQNTSK